ncbi:hypothetical protein [Clostridium sp. OS1-26]|nr:hypothetical protein [Clostridium sp. OS1-26]WML33228.1 hypothetical protein RCG18_17995 [Clostridium sp. OS1-26]
MNCKDCEFKRCLMRTDKEFDTCPVDVAKQKYANEKEKQQQK